MAGRLVERKLDGTLSTLMASPPADGIRFYWLGQAGFILEMAGRRLVVDPYLSNSLFEKYRESPRPHVRMMPPPIGPGECGSVDLVLATHAHTDHMDPSTLPAIFAANPAAIFVAPRAARQQALDRSGLSEDRMALLDANEVIRPFAGLTITATRAAHETLETDRAGNHRFLGYILEAGGLRIWHSGDCVPFEGLREEIAAQAPGIVLLPVNGRRSDLSDNGVPGNFTLDEAIETAHGVGAAHLVAHHYGLFDFNTEDPAVIDQAAASSRDLDLRRAQTGVCYEWQRD